MAADGERAAAVMAAAGRGLRLGAGRAAWRRGDGTGRDDCRCESAGSGPAGLPAAPPCARCPGAGKGLDVGSAPRPWGVWEGKARPDPGPSSRLGCNPAAAGLA